MGQRLLAGEDLSNIFILTVYGRIFTVVQWTVWAKVYKYQKEGTPSGV